MDRCLGADKSVSHQIGEDRKVWIQIVKGKLTVNGQVLGAGDGLGVLEPGSLTLSAQKNAEFLLFDLAA